VERHDLPFLLAEDTQRRFQQEPAVRLGIQIPLGSEVGVILDRDVFALTFAQLHIGEVAGDRHDPGHGFALRFITGGILRDADIGVLHHVFRRGRILQYGQRIGIHRRRGLAVEHFQLGPSAAGDIGDELILDLGVVNADDFRSVLNRVVVHGLHLPL